MCTSALSSIHNWATTLTRHHKIHAHDQPLTPHHFTALARDKHFSGILTYLVRHVHPPEEQRIIKLNLKHAAFRKHLRGRKKVEEEEEDGPDSENQLRLRAALLDASMAISAEVKEIQLINQRMEEGHQSECEARRQAATLAVARQQGEETSRRYQRQSQLLDDLKQHGVQRGGDGKGPTSVTVQRQLKANLVDIKKFHHASISSQLYSPENIHQQKVHLWEGVGASLYEYGPQALLGALVGETRGAVRALHSLLQDADLARDARELRLKCEKDGTFIDERNPEGVMKGVRELLHLMCASHIQLYLHARRVNAQAASLTRALATLTNNITTAAKRSYSDEAVSGKVIEVIQGNIALAGEQAALSTTLALISDLQQRADQATRAREAIRAKHERILSFDRKVDPASLNSYLEKRGQNDDDDSLSGSLDEWSSRFSWSSYQRLINTFNLMTCFLLILLYLDCFTQQEAMAMIHSLAWCVQESWPEIESALAQLRASISASLAHITTPTPAPAHPLSAEADAYTSLPLAYLLTADCDGLGLRQKLNLSTASLLWHPHCSCSDGWDVVNQLRPGVTCWEALYQTVCEKLAHAHALQVQLNRLSFLRAATHKTEKGEISTVLSTQEMKRLKEEVEEHDRRQEAEVLRLTEGFEKELSRGTELVAAVTRLLKDWWEQPAKDIPVKKLQAV